MVGRRAAALALLVLLLAGCGSSKPQRHVALPAGGRAGVVRIGLAHVLWPLDPTHARGRDEVTLARALFATPLRTDPGTGALRPGLCSAWHGAGLTWRLRCRHSGAIAAQLRRAALFPARRIRAADEHTLVISLKAPLPELPVSAHAGRRRSTRGAGAVQADLGEPGARRRRAAGPSARRPQARAARGIAPLPRGRARRGAGAARRPARVEARPAARARGARAPAARGRRRGLRSHRSAGGAPGLRRHRRPRRLPGARARVRGSARREPHRSQPSEGEPGGDRPAGGPQEDPVAAEGRRPLCRACRPRSLLRPRTCSSRPGATSAWARPSASHRPRASSACSLRTRGPGRSPPPRAGSSSSRSPGPSMRDWSHPAYAAGARTSSARSTTRA